MVTSQTSLINFFFETKATLTNRLALKAFLRTLCRKEGYTINTINFIFCSDEQLLEINRSFLKHDYYTDIITFGHSGANEPIESDIYISIDRVTENALTHREAKYKELHRVIFHGVLHLCGYKDKTKAAKSVMRTKEDYYLDRYFK